MKTSIKQTLTYLAMIIGLSAMLSACDGGSGGDTGMGTQPENVSSLTTLK
ncbi:MAG: hypothetical protein V3V18_14615 [Methylococcales bacterium]